MHRGVRPLDWYITSCFRYIDSKREQSLKYVGVSAWLSFYKMWTSGMKRSRECQIRGAKAPLACVQLKLSSTETTDLLICVSGGRVRANVGYRLLSEVS